MDDAIETILALATQDLRRRMEEAFEAGGEKVRRELLAALRQNGIALDAALAEHAGDNDAQEAFGPRAQLGTVKPTILRLIGRYKHGLSPMEIVAKTGFKVNSVRSTLATLRNEGLAERDGNLWFRRERKSTSLQNPKLEQRRSRKRGSPAGRKTTKATGA
jgi:IclR helix-turn-helix domain